MTRSILYPKDCLDLKAILEQQVLRDLLARKVNKDNLKILRLEQFKEIKFLMMHLKKV
jgi:hypothetical protein